MKGRRIPELTRSTLISAGSCRRYLLLPACSLRERSFSRFLTYEAVRILEHMGAEVKIFDPIELPMVGSVPETHPEVAELRELFLCSEGQVWCSPERHGAVTEVMKNQID